VFTLLPPDNATGNFTKVVQRVPVRIQLDMNQPLLERLLPGMSVVTHINTGEAGADGGK
jgi:membrane fusion protein (multidrug efflux system)